MGRLLQLLHRWEDILECCTLPCPSLPSGLPQQLPATATAGTTATASRSAPRSTTLPLTPPATPSTTRRATPSTTLWWTPLMLSSATKCPNRSTTALVWLATTPRCTLVATLDTATARGRLTPATDTEPITATPLDPSATPTPRGSASRGQSRTLARSPGRSATQFPGRSVCPSKSVSPDLSATTTRWRESTIPMGDSSDTLLLPLWATLLLVLWQDMVLPTDIKLLLP